MTGFPRGREHTARGRLFFVRHAGEIVGRAYYARMKTKIASMGAAAGLAAIVALAGCAPRESSAERRPSPEPSASPTTAKATELPVLGAAPAWKAVTLDGKPVGRDELKGKVVVLDIWATWCAPCLHEIPGYVRLQEKYRDQGLVIVGLSADGGPEAVNRFIAKQGVNYPVAMLGSDVLEAFGEKDVVMPTTYLMDREGRVRHRKVGAAEERDYEQLIRSLL